MKNRRFVHLSLFIISLISLCIAFFYFFNEEDKKCLGIDIVSENEFAKYNYQYKDYADEILFYDERVAVDKSNSTIYIPQKIVEGTSKRELKGNLILNDSEFEMYFVVDDYFNDLFDATKTGHSFRLRIVNDVDQYMEYNVVFTTMPVLRVDGEYDHIDDYNREVMAGEMCLWPSNFKDGEHNLVQASDLEWRIRGNSSSFESKKPWKMSLKKDNGKNKDLDLLGLGADDDWILNPMSLDDLKLREKLFIDLWNETQRIDNYNYPMSNGEYVELVLNGKYYGLFLLQRRVDNKYLDLKENDILLKGKQIYMPIIPEDYFEIKYSGLEKDETFEITKGICLDGDVSNIDVNNIIDISLFVQFAAATDNELYKNIYYIYEEQLDESYKLKLLPWDTDVSFGVDWDGDFLYDFDENINVDITRPELKIALDQNLIKQTDLNTRWKELSVSVLNADYVKEKIAFLETYLINSGAYGRDAEMWGKRYDGTDNFESIYQFINERTEWMNNKYKD